MEEVDVIVEEPEVEAPPAAEPAVPVVPVVVQPIEIVVSLKREVFINGRKYGPGENVSVPSDAYDVWKNAL
jgi:hypothetical protein